MIILVPAGTWFIMNSLRKARETVIAPGESISIRVQSLVKIYERESRWRREWNAGARIRKRLGLEKEYTSWKDLSDIGWQFPLLAFMVYFTYFYLDKGFWIFIFSIGSWFFLSAIWNQVRKLLDNKEKAKPTRFRRIIVRIADFSVFWLIPLINLVWFQMKWDNIVVVLILGLLWFTGLFIYKTGQKLIA